MAYPLKICPRISAIDHSRASIPEQFRYKLPTIAETAEIFNKYLGLFRFPFYGASTLFGVVKHLPLNENQNRLLESQRAYVGFVLSSLQIPRFFLNQIRFIYACRNLRECVDADLALRKVKIVFLSAGSLASSAIGVALLFNKMKFIRLENISKGFAFELVRGRNLVTLSLAGIEFIDSISALGKRIESEQSCLSKSSELSPEIWKELCNATSKTLTLTFQLTKTAALFFGVCVNPAALTVLSTASFGLALKKFIETNSDVLWQYRSCIQIRSSYHLPA